MKATHIIIYLFGFLLVKADCAFSQPVIDIADLLASKKTNITGETVCFENDPFYTLIEIDTVNENRWVRSNKENGYHLGFSRNKYWFKFSICCQRSTKEKIILLVGNKGINSMELFYKKDNRFKSLGKKGDHEYNMYNEIETTDFYYPIDFFPGDTTTYYLLCDKRNENLNVSFNLYSEKGLTSKENKSGFYMGLFVGVLTLASFISFFLYLSMNEKLNLWYSLYVLSVIYYMLTLAGYDISFSNKSFPLYADSSRFIASSLTLFFMIYVMQLFCKQNAENSKYFTYANLTKWASVLMIPATLIVYQWFQIYEIKITHYYFFIFLQYSGIISIIFSCVEKIIQRYKPAYFYFFAICILMVSGVMATLVEIGVLDLSIETPNQLQWSFILEVIIIANGILYRYNLIKKENENLFEELNRQKVESIRSMLEIRNKEQQRIAEDLHDMLGGQLSALKLKLNSENTETVKPELTSLIDKISESTRQIVHDLIPHELNNNSVSDIIAAQMIQLNQSGKIHFEFIQIGDPIDFKKETEMNVYKILMEAINNVIKHSDATEATIQFFFQSDHLKIMIEDNGKGISTTDVQGFGLKNIHKRVEMQRGKINIDSRPGNTTIIITIPIENE